MVEVRCWSTGRWIARRWLRAQWRQWPLASSSRSRCADLVLLVWPNLLIRWHSSPSLLAAACELQSSKATHRCDPVGDQLSGNWDVRLRKKGRGDQKVWVARS